MSSGLRSLGIRGQEETTAALTFLGGGFVFLLNQQVAGALREEGQEDELQGCGHPSQPQKDRPACKPRSTVIEVWGPVPSSSTLYTVPEGKASVRTKPDVPVTV